MGRAVLLVSIHLTQDLWRVFRVWLGLRCSSVGAGAAHTESESRESGANLRLRPWPVYCISGTLRERVFSKESAQANVFRDRFIRHSVLRVFKSSEAHKRETQLEQTQLEVTSTQRHLNITRRELDPDRYLIGHCRMLTNGNQHGYRT